MTKVHLTDGYTVLTLLSKFEVECKVNAGLRDKCMVYLSYGGETNLVNPYCVTRVEE